MSRYDPDHDHENNFVGHGRLSEVISRDPILEQGLILEKKEVRGPTLDCISISILSL